jgi:hypothetical protein
MPDDNPGGGPDPRRWDSSAGEPLHGRLRPRGHQRLRISSKTPQRRSHVVCLTYGQNWGPRPRRPRSVRRRWGGPPQCGTPSNGPTAANGAHSFANGAGHRTANSGLPLARAATVSAHFQLHHPTTASIRDAERTPAHPRTRAGRPAAASPHRHPHHRTGTIRTAVGRGRHPPRAG